jgi:glutamate decarboxylase
MAGSIRGRREFQLLADPQMNILLYRCLPDTHAERVEWLNAFNLRLHRAQRRAGRSFVSRTLLERASGGDAGIVALRAVLANPLTTEHDIDAVLDDQTGISAELAAWP